jgi:DNA-binding NarL/FixJ family response regulator
MHIAFLTKDLMFQSRVASLAKFRNLGFVADRSLEKILGRVEEPSEIRLWIVDLTLDQVDLTDVRTTVSEQSPNATLIAYGPHVHESRLQQAVAAGFDHVLTRGQFDRDMGDIFGTIAG